MNKLLFAIAVLLASNTYAQSLPSAVLLDTDMAWTGQPIGERVKIRRYVVPAGKQTPVHEHTYPFCAYLEQGVLEIAIEGKNDSMILTEGDAYCEVLNIMHYGTSLSREDAVLIVFELPNHKP